MSFWMLYEEWIRAGDQQTVAWVTHKLRMVFIYLFIFKEGYKSSFFFFNLFTLFIYFWRHWVFVATCGLSLVAASGGYSLLRCTGFSLLCLLLLWSLGSRCAGFSSCGSQAQQLWLTGLVAPQHVGSSQTSARTRVPCIGRRILNHSATREALRMVFTSLSG